MFAVLHHRCFRFSHLAKVAEVQQRLQLLAMEAGRPTDVVWVGWMDVFMLGRYIFVAKK